MLEILDLNTPANKLDKINRLKDDFRSTLTNVKNGIVLIICDFPANEIIDYLVIVNINKESGNYHRTKVWGEYHYVDNIVLAISEFDVGEVDEITGQYLISNEATFDYVEETRKLNKGFKKYFEPYGFFSHSLLNVQSSNGKQYFYSEILANNELTAKRLIKSYAYQEVKRDPKVSRIMAFKKSYQLEDNQKLKAVIKRLIEDSRDRFKIGILTKKKLDLISVKKNKIVDEIEHSIGNNIHIITGKAGTGKTVYLAKVIYRLVQKKEGQKSHRARFLTFNHMLIKDIRATLREYGEFNASSFSTQTIHQYFYKLAKDMNIPNILGADRVEELMSVCNKRFDMFKPIYKSFGNKHKFSGSELLREMNIEQSSKANFNEFLEIANYFSRVNDFRNWEKIKSDYLKEKKRLLQNLVGSKIFLEDYNKVLEVLYLSLTDPVKFYNDYGLKDRIDFLDYVKVADTDEAGIPREITEEDVLNRVKTVRRSIEWSTIFIDEGQDCELFEKQILFEIRKPENIVVASGGKEQLIRTKALRQWEVSNGQKIFNKVTRLSGSSHRQKGNLIGLVNELANKFVIDLKLKSERVGESKGKVILDLRQNFSDKSSFDNSLLNDLLSEGELQGCSPYESLMILVTPNFTTKEFKKSLEIDATDYIKEVDITINRRLNDICEFDKKGVNVWVGIGENKSELTIPYQKEVRLMHYESCRGLESWSVVCMDLDSFIREKRKSQEAKGFMSQDLFLSDKERKDLYTMTWLLMAFTRPMDTLYLDFRESNRPLCELSKKIISFIKPLPGVQVLK